MQSIKIDTGIKTIAITDANDNVTGEIKFNPSDVAFAERFQKLFTDIKVKLEEIKSQNLDELDQDSSEESVAKRFKAFREINAFIREKIDYVFGEGTSQIAFGDTISFDLDIYFQFINGIKSFIQPVRGQKVEQFLPKNNPNVKKAQKGMRRGRK